MKPAPILFCGDPHSKFRQMVAAAHDTSAQSVILLGDMEPERPLELEMAPLDRAGVEWYFIAGNHDADSQAVASRVWNQHTDPHNVHGRVVTLRSGVRLAGLAGVFRGDVWYPKVGGKNGGRSSHYSREDLGTIRSKTLHPTGRSA